MEHEYIPRPEGDVHRPLLQLFCEIDLQPFGTAMFHRALPVGSGDDLERAVFRALTRLRGAAITSFDGIARSQTGNIDEYNHLHKSASAASIF